MEQERLAEDILGEIRAIAMARATDFLQIKDGTLEIQPTAGLPPGLDAAIAAVEQSNTGLKLKFYDKLKALELLGRAMGLFEPRAVWQDKQETNLLQAILDATGKELDTHDIPELQQASAACHDLVEQAEAETI